MAFYSYVKCKQKVKASIPPLERSDSSLTTSNQESANVLASFFEITFTIEDTSSLPSYISEEIVFHKLCNLKPFKSPGPDSLHAYVLKACADCLAKPLCILYT